MNYSNRLKADKPGGGGRITLERKLVEARPEVPPNPVVKRASIRKLAI